MLIHACRLSISGRKVQLVIEMQLPHDARKGALELFATTLGCPAEPRSDRRPGLALAAKVGNLTLFARQTFAKLAEQLPFRDDLAGSLATRRDVMHRRVERLTEAC